MGEGSAVPSKDGGNAYLLPHLIQIIHYNIKFIEAHLIGAGAEPFPATVSYRTSPAGAFNPKAAGRNLT